MVNGQQYHVVKFCRSSLLKVDWDHFVLDFENQSEKCIMIGKDMRSN